VRIAGKFLDK